jgi:hypothetical protein
MAKGENLEVAIAVRAGVQVGQVDRQAREHIDGREEHEAGR